MASTLKVDNLQTQDGDSYNVVSWDTTAKTEAFTAVSGKGYFVDTSSAAITVTLPASPSAGDIVAVKDYAGTAATNAITIARNGSNIRGDTNDFILEKNNAGATFIYIDGTEGWQVFVGGSDGDVQPTFICASGGTETTCGDYKIHTFTGPGTFTVNSLACVPANNSVDYLVVAGGGSGGIGCSGGGGGAGGFRESSGEASGCYTTSPLGACVSALPVSVTSYPITVGGGGGGSAPFTALPSFPSPTKGDSGSNSVFSTITSAGGGGGGGNGEQPGKNGGSGGGGAHNSGSGGTGNTPPVSPPQGNNGAASQPTTGPAPSDAAGGGGGATAVGTPNSTNHTGGAGATTSINGTPTAYAGGGGGTNRCAGCASDTAGGTGGGGRGGFGSRPTPDANARGVDGTANTGGGGGGGKALTAAPTNRPYGGSGSGGSGIVIIRYKYQ